MRKALRLIHSLVCWLVSLLIILTLGMTIVMMSTLFSDRSRRAFKYGQMLWGRATLLMGGVWLRRIGVQNIPRTGNFIYAVNHSSSLDIIVLSASIPAGFRFVMDEILFRVPIVGLFCRTAGFLPISRLRLGRVLNQMKDIVSTVKAGDSVVFFPEGGRSRDGKLMEFKSGIGLLVEETGVPVIPVAIKGTFDIMPRMSPILRPGTVTIEFGPPLYLDRTMGQKPIADAVHAKVEAMLSNQIK